MCKLFLGEWSYHEMFRELWQLWIKLTWIDDGAKTKPFAFSRIFFHFRSIWLNHRRITFSTHCFKDIFQRDTTKYTLLGYTQPHQTILDRGMTSQMKLHQTLKPTEGAVVFIYYPFQYFELSKSKHASINLLIGDFSPTISHIKHHKTI